LDSIILGLLKNCGYPFISKQNSIQSYHFQDTLDALKVVFSHKVKPCQQTISGIGIMDSFAVVLRVFALDSITQLLTLQRSQRILQKYYEEVLSTLFCSEKLFMVANGYVLLVALISQHWSNDYIFHSILMQCATFASLDVTLRPILHRIAEQLVLSVGSLSENQAESIVKFLSLLVQPSQALKGETIPGDHSDISTVLKITEIMVEALKGHLNYRDASLLLIQLRYHSYPLLPVQVKEASVSNEELLLFMIDKVRAVTEDIALECAQKFLDGNEFSQELLKRLIPFLLGFFDKDNNSHKIKAAKCLGRISPYVKWSTMSSDKAADGHVVVLNQLRIYCGDADAKICSAASRALKTILSTAEGQEAFLRISRESQSFLDIFSSRAQTRALPPPRLKLEYPQLSSESLWKCSNKPYTEWIVSLANSIISHCETDQVYRVLGAILECVPNMASEGTNSHRCRERRLI
jgi:hypothetical protein